MVKIDQADHHSEGPLGFDGKSEPAPDSDSGNRSKLPSLYGACPSEFPGQNSPIHFLFLTLGFTLVELVIVICVIGALAAIVVPNYYVHIRTAQTTKVISEMRGIEKVIIIFSLDNESYPDSLDEIGWGGVLDPWGNPYRYLNIDKINTKDDDKVTGKDDDKVTGKDDDKVKGKDDDKVKGKDDDKVTGGGVGQMRKDRFKVPINSDFDLYSMGPDGKSATPLTSKNSYDDIIRGSDGAYFGVASGY